MVQGWPGKSMRPYLKNKLNAEKELWHGLSGKVTA
jgi:hypothetical protein